MICADLNKFEYKMDKIPAFILREGEERRQKRFSFCSLAYSFLKF